MYTCSEFCRQLGIPENVCGCWACHEENKFQLISPVESGLDQDSMVCCWVKAAFDKLNGETND